MNFTFKDLRQSYIEIKQLVEKHSWEKVKDLNTRIAEDLGLYGDDNLDVIERIINKYQLDYSNFDYSKHFETEQEIFGGWNGLLGFIRLPLYLLRSIIEQVFPNTKHFFSSINQTNQANDKDDLTVGDLIAWKLKGSFCLRKDLEIKLVPSN